jgi:hypothetical protein
VIDDATLARLATCCRWVPVVTLSRLPHRLRGAEVVRLLVLDRSQSSHFQTPPSRWCDPQDTAPHYNVLCSCCDLTLNEIYLKSHLHSPPRPLQWRPVLPSLTQRLHRLLRGSLVEGNGPRGANVSGEVKLIPENATPKGSLKELRVLPLCRREVSPDEEHSYQRRIDGSRTPESSHHNHQADLLTLLDHSP